MRLKRKHNFDQVTAYETGFSLIGPPIMTTHFYIFGDTMIDTGQSRMRKEILEIAASHRIKKIYLTHYHEDHSGNASAIKKQNRADVFGHPLTVELVRKPFKILPYQKYMWGRSTPLTIHPTNSAIQTALGPMQPVHTPGHSADHTSYFIESQGILFSGDLYLGDRIKYFRTDEDIASQVESLKKVLALNFDTLLCSHAPKRTNGRKHIRRKLEFLEDLQGKILFLWDKGMSEKEIFSTLQLKEQRLAVYFCFGDVSMMNGVRSAVRSAKKRAKN